MVASIKKNDRIVTVGGIHATVVNVKNNTLIIRIDDNTKAEIDKNSIAAKK
jgi:preprotein translocase subunit YajC